MTHFIDSVKLTDCIIHGTDGDKRTTYHFPLIEIWEVGNDVVQFHRETKFHRRAHINGNMCTPYSHWTRASDTFIEDFLNKRWVPNA